MQHLLNIFKTKVFNISISIWQSIYSFATDKKSYLWLKKHLFKPCKYPAIFISLVALIIISPSITPSVSLALKTKKLPAIELPTEQIELEINSTQKQLSKINNTLDALVPSSYYLIINSTTNRFYLYNGTQLIKSDKCSTGSYIMLEKDDQKKWIFKTPKGVFKIQNKRKSPVWKKPDWAFVEEGLPIPSMNHQSRFEYGVLGDYALSLGDGYMIHGTLYQRLLGLPVTHGCIRLDDKNLELIFKSLKIGSKVYIF